MNILLGVTGGIAAYKAAEIVSRCIKRGHTVRVVMTPAATHFVAPLTFEALSGQPVMTQIFATGHALGGVSSVEHIEWAKWADAAVIAPLTAATMSKLATGLADNALTTVWLALPAATPSILCPAMNTEMWNHPATQRNLQWLADCGRHAMVEPTSKRLACGDVGVGGLAEVSDIVEAIQAALAG